MASYYSRTCYLYDVNSLHRQGSGGATCLTLLVQRMVSSKVANNVADSIRRVRQVMP